MRKEKPNNYTFDMWKTKYGNRKEGTLQVISLDGGKSITNATDEGNMWHKTIIILPKDCKQNSKLHSGCASVTSNV